MFYLTWFTFYLLIGGYLALVIKIIAVAGRGSAKITPFFNQEQFVSAEPVLQILPKGQMKNSHWFTHTFMRPRRKG
ncbi:hypothetical protein [Sporosarcina psychrophila]|uniref:Glycopeptide antibiotics resistance protein n=1 Tax=Sporosarcina psychrophila TaxID=1476 RepID=A0ABV2KAP2_SPOPS